MTKGFERSLAWRQGTEFPGNKRQTSGLTGLKPKRPVMCVLCAGKPEIVPSGGSGGQSRVLRQVKR